MNQFDVLRDEAAVLSAKFATLSQAELQMPTRCEPWDLRTLGGHIIRGIERTAGMLDQSDQAHADANRLIYYQSPLRSDPGRDQVRVEGAMRAAERFTSGAEIAAALTGAALSIEQALLTVTAGDSVQTHWGPVIRVDDYLLTRIVELAVHGIDIADCLGVAPWITPAASAMVAQLLRDLLNVQVPGELAWTHLDMVRIGTRRRLLTAAESELLGDLAQRFPLIR